MVLELGCVSRPARHASQVELQQGMGGPHQAWVCSRRLGRHSKLGVHAAQRPERAQPSAHLVLLTERYVLPVHLVQMSLPGSVPTLLVG